MTWSFEYIAIRLTRLHVLLLSLPQTLLKSLPRKGKLVVSDSSCPSASGSKYRYRSCNCLWWHDKFRIRTKGTLKWDTVVGKIYDKKSKHSLEDIWIWVDTHPRCGSGIQFLEQSFCLILEKLHFVTSLASWAPMFHRCNLVVDHSCAECCRETVAKQMTEFQHTRMRPSVTRAMYRFSMGMFVVSMFDTDTSQWTPRKFSSVKFCCGKWNKLKNVSDTLMSGITKPLSEMVQRRLFFDTLVLTKE